MRDFVGQAQEVIAGVLRKCEWFAQNRVEIIEQNKAELKFLMDRQLAALKNVVLVVGCDSVDNQQTGLELAVTVSALEYVQLNRAGGDGTFVTAIQAVEAVIDIMDGEWWHFDRLEHTTPAERTLQCTAVFRGIFDRETLNNGGDNG